tara:strand:- start:159 stop:371 length:213 start_codon:yes stop_codon:yes gene_type:complete
LKWSNWSVAGQKKTRTGKIFLDLPKQGEICTVRYATAIIAGSGQAADFDHFQAVLPQDWQLSASPPARTV